MHRNPLVLDYTYAIERPMLPFEVDRYFRILRLKGEREADRYRRKCCIVPSISTSRLKLKWPRGSRFRG